MHLELQTRLGTEEQPHVLQIFLTEDFNTKALQKQHGWRNWKLPHFRYGTCFGCVFWGMGVLGVSLFGLLLWMGNQLGAQATP